MSNRPRLGEKRKTQKAFPEHSFRSRPRQQQAPTSVGESSNETPSHHVFMFWAIVSIFTFVSLLLIFWPSGAPQEQRRIGNPDVPELRPEPKPEVAQPGRSQAPDLEQGPQRLLPEGRIGEWAKSVVFIECGQLDWTGSRFSRFKSGTGFLISQTGEILTNEHVISDANVIAISFYDGTREIARVTKADAELDVALLKTAAPSNVPALELEADDQIRMGRKILVLGFPLGSSLGKEMTLTDGLISSIRHNSNGTPFWYQISAAVNSGNSGGPLLDAETGKVLGVVTAKIDKAENIALARPIKLISTQFLR